jgi:hypothetical protein
LLRYIFVIKTFLRIQNGFSKAWIQIHKNAWLLRIRKLKKRLPSTPCFFYCGPGPVRQDPRISNSPTFNTFLLAAQQETRQEQPENVSLDVYLMNEHKVSLNILTTEQTDAVLEKACHLLTVPESLVYCFSLFLIRRDEDGDITIVRKLQDFESPYISQKTLAGPACSSSNAGRCFKCVVDPDP